MKQVTIKAKATIVVVDLPYDAFNVKVNKGYIKYNNSKFSDIISSTHLSQKKEGNWKNVGRPSQLTEEDWKGIVDEEEESDIEDHRYAIVYPDYTDDEKAFSTATESGLSLLKANGVDDSWLNPQAFIEV